MSNNIQVLDEKYNKIQKIDVKKTVNRLSVYHKSNEENGTDFFLSTSHVSMLNKIKKDELTSEPFMDVIRFTVHNREDLTKEELEKHLDLVEEGLLTKSFETSKELTKNLPKLVNHFKSIFLEELNSLMKHYAGFKKNWNVHDMTEQELKEAIRFMSKILLEDDKVDEKIKSAILKKLTEKQNETLFDTSFMGEKLYVLNLVQNIDEAIKTKEFFTIEEKTRTKRSVGANGEHMTYASAERGSPNVTVNNSAMALTIYLSQRGYVYFDKEEAIQEGKKKVSELRKALSEFERVAF